MKSIKLLTILFLLFATSGLAQNITENYTPEQKDFYNQCTKNSAINWLYDCACASEEALKIQYDLYLTKYTDYCEQGELLNPQIKRAISQFNPFDPNNETKYDNACQVLEIIKEQQPANISKLDMYSLFRELPKKNICKNSESIRARALSECAYANQEYCDCYADTVTTSWMEATYGMSSQASIEINTKARNACSALK